MKHLLKFAFVFLLVLSSCSDENSDVIIPSENNSAPESLVTNLTTYARTATSTNQEASIFDDDIDCFTVNYPYSVTDGMNATVINNDEELEAYFDSLEDTPSGGASFMIEVPFTVTLEDGTQQTIADYDAFEMLIDDCYGMDDDDDDDYDDDYDDDDIDFDECFTLNFPISVYDEDGGEITINSDEEFFTTPFIVGFVYPFDVTLEDGTIVTVADANEFDSLYNDCFDIEDCDDCEENCFEIVFPMSFVSGSGTVTTVSDEDALFEFLDNLTPNDFISISYPINVELEDGVQQTINSDEEFDTLLDTCYN